MVLASATVKLRVRSLTRRYEGVTALDDVSVAIPEGRTALLGPNGAGKSTLLKCVLGLVRPTAGDIEVLGIDPRRDPLAVRARVGYMPEDDAHLPDLTAVELCAYGAELAGLPPREAIDRAHAALFYVGVDDKRYMPVQGYSTGLRQRTKLAAAIVHDPELLFLDEPTNGLDPASREEMLALIGDLRERRGCSVVLSTHLLADVERVCDHVVVLAAGKVVADAPLQEVLGRGDGRFLVRVKADDARFEGFERALRDLGCASDRSADARGEWVVRPATPDDPASIWEAALRADVQVRHLALRRASLDEAFLRILA
jgi:ABC-2 type transport system ATP-binding protein